MRDYAYNSQSEFEREFDMEFESQTLDSEFEDEFEFENEDESSDEMEFDNEYSSDSEANYLNEFEDNEFENNEFEENEFEENEFEFDSNGSREREFENRLYRALNSNSDNEFEMEQAMYEVFNEMEQDFFFKKLRRRLKKFAQTKGGRFLKKIAKNSPWGIAIQGLSKVARGDIKGALKGVLNNDLLKQAVSFAPGGSTIVKGMDIANKVMQGETPTVSKTNVGKTVQLAKGAYGHLANNMANMSNIGQLKTMGKDAVKKAMNDMRTHRKGMQKKRISIKAGSIVTVHSTHINIWEPK